MGDFVPVRLETNKVAWPGATAQPTWRAVHSNPVRCLLRIKKQTNAKTLRIIAEAEGTAKVAISALPAR